MKNILLIILISITFAKTLFSQNNYYPIQCRGEIPNEFIARTTDKIVQANENYKKSKDGLLKKTDFNKYNSMSNFYVDYLLKNGKIVFGTSMNQYVNEVGEKVLEQMPSIKKDIRFYIVKSPYVNAFTYEQGIVFINVGLIAQLESEAQLAYIISHELIHYKYKHSIKSYSEKIKAESNKGDYGLLNNDSKKDMLLQFSRVQEFMADSLGFIEAYAKTKYDLDEVINVFDVLLYSNLPFDDIEFDTNFFDDANYKVNPKNILVNVNPISNQEDYDDTKSDHPNIKKRRTMMINLVTSYDNTNTKKYIVSKRKFKELQKEARFEMSNLFLENLDYGKAFYNSYILLKKYPENKYLKKTMAYSIYAIAIYKYYGNLSDVLQKYKQMEGESQRVNYFFYKAKVKTLILLAIKQLWRYHQEYPDDQFVNSLLDKAVKFKEAEFSIDYSKILSPIFSTKDSASLALAGSKAKFKVLSKKEFNNLSKYNKIRYNKKYLKYYGYMPGNIKKHSLSTSRKNYLTILSTEKAESGFKELFTRYSKDNGSTKENKLNISKINLVNPIFYQVNNDNLIVINTENKEITYSNAIKNMAHRLSISTPTLDILNIKQDEVDKFNDLALLNSWLKEYELLSKNNLNDYIIPWSSNYIGAIRKKYDMRYLSHCGLVSFNNKQDINKRIKYLIKAIILWQASPYFLYNMISNKHYLYYYFYCVDLENNKTVLLMDDLQKGQFGRDYINSINYNIMYKLKHK